MCALHSNDKPSFPSTNSIVFDSSQLNEESLKNIGIQPCLVILDKLVLSKIKIKCPSSSKEDVKTLWDLKQQDSNNFTIRIKRKVVDNDCEVKSQKKVKFNEEITTVQPKNCIVESTSYVSLKLTQLNSRHFIDFQIFISPTQM